MKTRMFLFACATLLVACGGGSASSSGTSSGASSGSSSGGAGSLIDRGPTALTLDGDPSGLWWDAQGATLYIADNNGNRILKWTDKDGIVLAADLPPANANTGGLGQVVLTADGTLVVPRFGAGIAGDVVYVKSDGQGFVVPSLDPVRRRVGLTIGSDGTLYDGYFTSTPTGLLGAVARLDLAGSEVEIMKGLKTPVGVLAVDADLYVTDQFANNIVKAPIASPAQVAMLAPIDTPDLLCVGPGGSLLTGGVAGDVRQILSDGSVHIFVGGFQDIRGVAYDAENKRVFLSDHDKSNAGGLTHFLRILPVD